MLVKSLNELDEDGLMKRTDYMEVPIRVEYETLTAEFLPILSSPAKWGAGLNNLKMNME